MNIYLIYYYYIFKKYLILKYIFYTDGGKLSMENVKKYDLNDYGNRQRLVDKFEENILYCNEWYITIANG